MTTVPEAGTSNSSPKLDNRPIRKITAPRRYGCYQDLSDLEDGKDNNDDEEGKEKALRNRKKKRHKKVETSFKMIAKTSKVSHGSDRVISDLYSSLKKDQNILLSDLLSQDVGKDETSQYGANAFVCPECGKVLRSKLTLLRHIISHSGSKPFLCSFCNRGFSSAVALKEHKAVHDNTVLYECEVCSKGFRQNSTYRRHLLIHSQSYEHVCSICEKRFTSRDYLRSHMKVHNGEKKYQCGQCSKAFLRVSDLNRHKILHSGNRPFKCHICGMSFADSSSCRRHVKDHNSSQSYPCDLCKASFRKPLLLKQHLAKKHKITSSSSISDDTADKQQDICASAITETSVEDNVLEETESQSTIDVPDDIPSVKIVSIPTSIPAKDIACQDFMIANANFQQPIQSKQPLNEAVDYENFFSSDIQGVDFSQIPNAESAAFHDIPSDVQDHSCVEMFCSDLQQVPNVTTSYSIGEEPISNSLHLDYVTCPDFNSQVYYTWLSDFTELCKLLTFPIEPDLFNKISQVHKSIADVLAEPLGLLSNKANFKVLMSISEDLLRVTNGHLSFVYEHLQE